MKKLIVLILLILFCSDTVIFELQAQTEAKVYQDTTITYAFVMNRTSSITAFGVDLFYDSTKVKYINSKTFDKFEFELIDLINNEQGGVRLGFSNVDPVKCVIGDTLFTMSIYVKFDEPGQFQFSYDSLYAEVNGKSLESRFMTQPIYLDQLFSGSFEIR